MLRAVAPSEGRAARRLSRTPIATSELREIAARAKLILPMALEWRNWQTQQTQNLPPVTRHGGSTPPSSTIVFRPAQAAALRDNANLLRGIPKPKSSKLQAEV